MSTDSTDKKKRVRSPAYPAFGLEDCIAKASAIYKAEDRHFAPLEAIASHWEYKTNNSNFQQYVSALKQFGLLHEEGSGDTRKLRLTDRAMDILTYEQEHQKWKQSIQDAALDPKIHRELWDKYGGKLPREDVSIRVYLVREREEGGFNKDHVDGFIAQFRATIEFAKLASPDTMRTDIGGGSSTEKKQNVKNDEEDEHSDGSLEKPKRRRKMEAGTQEFVFGLEDDEGEVVVQLPKRMSKTNAQDVKDWLEIVGRKIDRAAAAAKQSSSTDDEDDEE